MSEYHAAVDGGRIQRGDVVFVSATLYAALGEQERSWLWRSSLEARVSLVTDVEIDPPIVVRRGWAAGDAASDASPRP